MYGWASLTTVLFPDGGVSGVLKSSCIFIYTAVFRAPLPCPQKKISVFRGAQMQYAYDTQASHFVLYRGITSNISCKFLSNFVLV